VKLHSSSRPTLFLALGLLLAPAARAAEPAPARTDPVALHPCAVTGEKNKDKLQDYQTACATEIAPGGEVQLVPPDQVLAFLDKEPRKSCALAKVPAECLGRLATATQASRAVLITVSPGQLTRVSGTVYGNSRRKQ